MPPELELPVIIPLEMSLVAYPSGGFAARGGGVKKDNRCSKIEGTSCNNGAIAPCDESIIICVDKKPVCKPIPVCSFCSGCNCPLPPKTAIYRYLDPTGNDTDNDCTDIGSPCLKIQHAIDVAAAGDALLLTSGTYIEANIVVTKDLYIYGQGAQLSIVDANQAEGVFRVNQGLNVSFCGLTMTGGSTERADGGGGLLNYGTANIVSSAISNNFASMNGGLSNQGIINISYSTINNNSTNTGGGGIHNQNSISSAVSTISNSTISGNRGVFGGVFINGSTININNSTITNNAGFLGAGISNISGTVNSDHNIIADQDSNSDCFGPINDLGFNLDKDGTCISAGTSQTVAVFTLPLLANNGGSTQTHALIPGGDGAQAINAGGATCGVTIDQRGEPRPPIISGNCDIGSFEVQP